MQNKRHYGLLMLVLTLLACSPVIAISWNEFLIVALVFALLLGPPLYRFIRKVDDFWKKK